MDGPQPHERTGANAAVALREAVGRARQRHRSKQATTRSLTPKGARAPGARRCRVALRYPMKGPLPHEGFARSSRPKAPGPGSADPEVEARQRLTTTPLPHHFLGGPCGTPLSPTAPPMIHYVRCAYVSLACSDAPKFLGISKKMSTWPI